MTYSRIQVRPASTALGAEILGLDLATPLAGSAIDEVRQALFDFGVVFFRDQQLTPEQHLGFARHFGDINVNRFFAAVDGYPEIAEVRKEPEQHKNIGGNWHTDHSYDAAPAMGSILYAREVPETGGDTLFASMYAAYEGLSEGLQQALERLQALHSSRHVFGVQADGGRGDLSGRVLNPQCATQDAVHPVVIRHPGSGRKALYVNPAFTVRFDGWTEAESQPLLRYLYQHAAQPEFSCRFHWRQGSVAFWDNRCTWHYALNDYHGHRRLMHRVTVEGVPLR